MGKHRTVFPNEVWQRDEPAKVGLDGTKLEALRSWLYGNAGDKSFRLLVVRTGRLVAEWNKGLDPEAQCNLASGAKSVYAMILGIAVAEGRLPSADALVVDYYPEMMDVPPGRGPKLGRYAFPKDRAITFRQLISNTSGYMKPGEEPGKVFHYQTFGMNILTHALGSIYGVYDTDDPGQTPGFGKLIDRYIKGPIGGRWSYRYSNFEHPPEARVEIFGNYCQMLITARDMARLGLLWLHEGRWRDRQLVPKEWVREASRVAPMIVGNCPREQWAYGYGMWSNEYGVLWPDLPKDAFASAGAGGQHIWMCPSLDLVVVQGPGFYEAQEDAICRHVLRSICQAIVD